MPMSKPATRRLERFFKAESSGGVLMIFMAVLALLAANSWAQEWYSALIGLPIGISIGGAGVEWALSHWVQDVLMVLFFLVVGMELKREMREGFLTDKSQVLLPLVAALGGMLAPAALFLFINRGIPENLSGWAIPSATDIAFALCILTLVGKGVPPALKIFLLAVAIFDDLGAILIIAFFYSRGLEALPFAAVIGIVIVLFGMNRAGVARIWPYILVGVALWFALHESGIHTTIGGVLTGMAIPMRDRRDLHHSPLNRAMHVLHPWVSFVILPLFAFTTAGVDLRDITHEMLTSPLVLGVALGLFAGKQVGIFGTSWLLIKTGRARLPEGTGWRQIYGVSLLAGIGFTMSLFIGMLAFDDTIMQEQVKLGVLMGSLAASVCGWLVLRTRAP